MHTAAENITKLAHLERILRQPDVNVNAKDRTSFTPLHYAVDMDNVKGIKMLLNMSDIDVNSRRQNRMTPLHDAVYRSVDKLTYEKC